MAIGDMPAFFIGHGNPMNALENNDFTRRWQDLGQMAGTPRAILVVSAHWYIQSTQMTVMQKPRTIHDFYGFPEALFQVNYPAPGLPELVGEVAEIIKPDRVSPDTEWGMDHGAWSVLTHMFPKANVPVVQLSIDATKPAAYHVAIGQKLSALRQQGVLLLSSGNVVHNLKMIDWSAKGKGTIWTQRFDEAVRDQMLENPADIMKIQDHPDYHMAVPTDDHLIPLFYTAGLASVSGGVTSIAESYDLGSLSMTCYALCSSS